MPRWYRHSIRRGRRRVRLSSRIAGFQRRAVTDVNRHSGGRKERLELRELLFADENRFLDDENRFARTHGLQTAARVEMIRHTATVSAST